MKASVLAILLISVAATHTYAQPSEATKQEERDYQNQNFQRWWGSELSWKFDELRREGVVLKSRVPYAGYGYPDSAGGTIAALRKYDQAFHGGRGRNGRGLAVEFERQDIRTHRKPTRVGLFGLRMAYRTPHWHGHCNGWTSASIRHAEPRKSVTRNGVVFTPLIIKGLLAELYMYSDTEFLGGVDAAINPGTFHVIISNWIGRGRHPVGMDTTIGTVAWNYPIYSYAIWSDKESANRAEVKMNIAYVMSTDREHTKAPLNRRTMNFHYSLDVNDAGDVAGGRYYGDSSRIDMLWVPLNPVQGGKNGNESGNPNVDVDEVLSIWRDSVPEDARTAWMNIDPTEEDRVIEAEDDGEAATEDGSPAAAEEPSDAPR